ncbi:hypothetical protein DT076_15980 [Desertihabitans brevis]|uniref:Aldolase n=1 Tax=Desertihabitans brevis TaxID=2268447 RepID=A0A367YRX1_9ACTN|nr:hypothetical protein DT076_15980 [Desertihabitans brevis]
MVDDAALFPPGDAPLPAAVAAHRRHRAAWYAPVVGPFVVADHRLDELAAALDADPFPCVLVVCGTVPDALARADRAGVPVAAVEVAVSGDDLVAAVDAVAGSLGSAADRPVLAVELPALDPDAAWLAACDRLVAIGARLKLRTGGVRAEAFPPTDRLARWLVAADERGLPVKCTAGLHAAVRHTDPATGFEHHGFLDVLAAVGALLDGAAEADVRDLLDRRDAAGLAATVAGWDVGTRGRVRERFTGFGSCSTTGPLDDLCALGLLEPPAGARP